MNPLSLFFCFACSDPGPLDGDWVFKDANGDVVGALHADKSKANIGLWGPSFGTNGFVDGVIGMKDDIPWVYFPVETGLGTADAALRLQGREAMLPLGARRGEHELRYSAQFGETVFSDEIDELASEAKRRITLSAKMWTDGGFLLQTNDEVVGQIQFLGADPPIVSLFDRYWLTPEPVTADNVVVGADIRLNFPIEPSLRNEMGLLVVNVPTLQGVAPVGISPDPLDRQFKLIPGRLSEAERAEKVARAILVADSSEMDLVHRQAKILSESAKTVDNCRQLSSMPRSTRLLWEGYAVVVIHSDGICEIHVEPDPVQHRRRFSGVAFPPKTR